MIYLDNHATTPCDPRVHESMVPYYTDYFGNASSNHAYGQAAINAVYKAVEQVKFLINGEDGDIIFTSGATESNNIVLIGLAQGHFERTGLKGKIVTTLIEHKAILSPLEHLEKKGWEIAYLPLDSTGLVDMNQARKIIDFNTVLVSIQSANSEIGTLQPIKELASLAHAKGAFIHTDAAQSIGKIKFDVDDLDVDMVSFSAHKIYGPKGIGALWIKPKFNNLIQPIIYGGSSGNRLRPGTLPIQLVVGFGTACAICSVELTESQIELSKLRDLFEQLLIEKIDGIRINGNKENRLPNNSNITFPDVDADMLLANLPEIIASTGSACESGSIEPSRVLTAIGISRESAYNSIRIGLGRFNTSEDIRLSVKMIATAYEDLLDIIGNY